MNFYDLSAKLRAIEEAGIADISQGPMVNSNSSRPTRGKAIDPVRDAPVDVEKQKVKPQANRPGLAPGGDPKLWDIQHELQKRGYKVKPDGLNGPATQKAVEMAQQNHNWIQDTEHPSAANIGSKIGKTLGDISAWVETTWRNLKASYKYSTYDQNIPYNENFVSGDEGLEECGDMGPMSMSAPKQSDSVTMNVSMNGSGPGGIKDLMSILRNIEQSAEHDHDHEEPMIAPPHGMDGDVDIVLGTADEDMLSNADESYGNSAPGGSDAHTYGIDSVTRKGDDMHSKGDVKRLRVNGGENPLQEALVERLSAMYQEIKEAKGKRTMSRAAKGIMKYGKKGMKALADAGRNGEDLEPIQDKFNKYKEGYNPNSVDAEHRRSLEKSHEDSLKKKAADGDESAKKRLQALKDKKERMRNDHNDRMER